MIYLDRGGAGPGLVPPEQALIPADDRGLLYGDGLFETALVRAGGIPLLPLHLARLTASAGALGIPCETEQVAEWARAVAQRAGGSGEFALRITLTRGAGARRGYAPDPAAKPTLLITIAPYLRPSAPLTAITSSVRVNPDSPLSRHKSLSALEKVLAAQEARQAGANEALLRNLAGRVVEAASANLFVRRGERWLTPPLCEGCLPGVMRARVIALSGATEEPLSPADLVTADGVFLTSALLGIGAVGQLDGKALRSVPVPPWGGALFQSS